MWSPRISLSVIPSVAEESTRSDSVLDTALCDDPFEQRTTPRAPSRFKQAFALVVIVPRFALTPRLRSG
jgi:hypothetical protein